MKWLVVPAWLVLVTAATADGIPGVEKRVVCGEGPGLESRVISGRLQARAGAFSTLADTVTEEAVPDYDWWYGCSPTSAGMLFGYYDIHGYLGKSFTNLVPDAIAEVSTFPSTEGIWETQVQSVIASERHVSDFYSGGYLATGDDLPGAPTGPLDSLADFMGTSQDAYGNVNGATTFWYRTDGSKLTVADLYSIGGPTYYEASGAYGIYEYLRYAGYGDFDPGAVSYIYNQYVDSLGLPSGFSFADYRAEIDAGRVVLVHLENHTMLGYGYDEATSELLVRDTANPGEQRMLWGGTYYGYALIGVTVVDLSTVAGDSDTGASALLKNDCFDATATAVTCGTGDGVDELALPQIIENPQNNWFAFRFLVREIGSLTNIHTTPFRGANYPGIPCDSPELGTVSRYLDDISYKGNNSRGRVHVLMRLVTECWESGFTIHRQAQKTVFYSADVVQNSGAKLLQWNDELAIDFAFADNYGGVDGRQPGTPDGLEEVTIFTQDSDQKGWYRTFGFAPIFPTWISGIKYNLVDQQSSNPVN